MSQQINGTGLHIVTAITVLLTGMKLMGYIDCSWWEVTAPMWLPPMFMLLLSAVMLFFMAVSCLLGKAIKKAIL